MSLSCRHEYEIDNKNRGTCKICGQVVQFDPDGKAPPSVLQLGQSKTSASGKAVEFTSDQKAAIAREARERGIKTVALEKKLPWTLIRAWVGCYCRRPDSDIGNARPENRRNYTLPSFPEFDARMSPSLFMLLFKPSPPDS